ncbi:hypothetical protein GCM10010284_49880 [Streptomyces rubiginosohelvolus]|uniref:Uncharacterized protein n=1 Tax=Streptomyces rubiginosohelvolus TaxID=67362 RepID=A0ABQ3C2X9_9ACTN|nr:hypothetical protein GCM10010284_49880 [Streptomyces rubiginosohelvolus]GGZ66002.1 hypothetical protein GCM10010328_46130 [Streptomyces pluricolorescens]
MIPHPLSAGDLTLLRGLTPDETHDRFRTGALTVGRRLLGDRGDDDRSAPGGHGAGAYHVLGGGGGLRREEDDLGDQQHGNHAAGQRAQTVQ